MIITQDRLINDISRSADMNTADVRRVFRTAEDIVTGYLSCATQENGCTVRLFNGLSLESNYVPPRKINRGVFQNHECSERIRISSSITRYYQDKVNKMIK